MKSRGTPRLRTSMAPPFLSPKHATASSALLVGPLDGRDQRRSAITTRIAPTRLAGRRPRRLRQSRARSWSRSDAGYSLQGRAAETVGSLKRNSGSSSSCFACRLPETLHPRRQVDDEHVVRAHDAPPRRGVANVKLLSSADAGELCIHVQDVLEPRNKFVVVNELLFQQLLEPWRESARGQRHERQKSTRAPCVNARTPSLAGRIKAKAEAGAYERSL